MKRRSFCEWMPMLPWPMWPLAEHARLGQNTVVGSMTILLSWLCWGACQEKVCLDPRFLCNLTPPRFSVELPIYTYPEHTPISTPGSRSPWPPSMSWSNGMVYSPTRLASCPSRWRSLVCKILISLLGLSETNTIGLCRPRGLSPCFAPLAQLAGCGGDLRRAIGTPPRCDRDVTQTLRALSGG